MRKLQIGVTLLTNLEVDNLKRKGRLKLKVTIFKTFEREKEEKSNYPRIHVAININNKIVTTTFL